MIVGTCGCGEPIVRKPGPGRHPKRCETCRGPSGRPTGRPRKQPLAEDVPAEPAPVLAVEDPPAPPAAPAATPPVSAPVAEPAPVPVVGAVLGGVQRDLLELPVRLQECAEAEAARALARAIDDGRTGVAGMVRELRAVLVGLRTRGQMMEPVKPEPVKQSEGGGEVVSWARKVADKRAAAARGSSGG